MDRAQLLIDDFNLFLERKDKNTSTYKSGDVWVTEFSCYNSFLKLNKVIMFYEFSDLNRKPRFFHNVNDFYAFLKECHIALPDYNMRQMIASNEILYAACFNGKPSLCIETSYLKLKQKIN